MRSRTLGRVGSTKLICSDLLQREEPLALARLANRAGDGVAGAQVEAAHLRRRDVDVVRAGLVVRVGAAQEAEAVARAAPSRPRRAPRTASRRLPERMAKSSSCFFSPCAALDAQVVGHLRQLGDLHPLEVVEPEDLHRLTRGPRLGSGGSSRTGCAGAGSGGGTGAGSGSGAAATGGGSCRTSVRSSRIGVRIGGAALRGRPLRGGRDGGASPPLSG